MLSMTQRKFGSSSYVVVLHPGVDTDTSVVLKVDIQDVALFRFVAHPRDTERQGRTHAVGEERFPDVAPATDPTGGILRYNPVDDVLRWRHGNHVRSGVHPEPALVSWPRPLLLDAEEVVDVNLEG